MCVVNVTLGFKDHRGSKGECQYSTITTIICITRRCEATSGGECR